MNINPISSTDVEVDSNTNSLVTISFPHHKIHDEESFHTEFVDETLADNATIILAFKTMSGTKRAHMWFDFTTLVGGDLQVWEEATWDTNTGVVNPILNLKRLASMTSSGLLEDLSATPVFTATDNVLSNVTNLGTGSATSIHHFYAWGIKGKAPAGGARDVEEHVLKPETQYAVVFTADGASNRGQIQLDWYEQTDVT